MVIPDLGVASWWLLAVSLKGCWPKRVFPQLSYASPKIVRLKLGAEILRSSCYMGLHIGFTAQLRFAQGLPVCLLDLRMYDVGQKSLEE